MCVFWSENSCTILLYYSAFSNSELFYKTILHVTSPVIVLMGEISHRAAIGSIAVVIIMTVRMVTTLDFSES